MPSRRQFLVASAAAAATLVAHRAVIAEGPPAITVYKDPGCQYVIQGHVPADVIKTFIAEKSPWLGLAVPGMPSGSPGMEDGRTDHYAVIAFDRRGQTRHYATR